MKKRLSTSLTFFLKYVYPGIFLLAFGIGTISAFITVGAESLLLLFGLIFLIVVFYFVFLRAKKVHIDDNYLYVSNFINTIEIPLDNIKHVSDNVFFSPRQIFIEFHNETEFGKKIMFMGYTELFLFFGTHPAVKEVKDRMEKYVEENRT